MRPGLVLANMATWDRDRGTYLGRATFRDDRELFHTPDDLLQGRADLGFNLPTTIEEALRSYPGLQGTFDAPGPG